MTRIESLTNQQIREKNTSRDWVIGDFCPSDFGITQHDECSNQGFEKGPKSCKECWNEEI